MLIRSVLTLSLLAACSPPPEVSEDDLGEGLTIAELLTFLYANPDGDLDNLQSAGRQLQSWINTVDLEGARGDRQFSLPALPDEAREGVTNPEGASAEDQLSVVVAGQSNYPLEDHWPVIADENQNCLGSNTTVYQKRIFEDDFDCFADGSCDTNRHTNEVRTESIIANVWLDIDADMRRFDMEDGRTFVFRRGWMPRQYQGDRGNNTWDQRYELEIWLPDPDDGSTTQRVYAMWSAVSISGVGDDFYLNLVTGGINDALENVDSFLGGEVCDGRDAAPERPAD